MAVKRYYIFGQGISFSKSPAIHTAAFRHYGLPHTYEIRESNDVEDFRGFIESDDFGGGSVTMPHKLSVSRYCVGTTQDAKRIGAVNTLVVDYGKLDEGQRRQITGDNTDWSGLRSIITSHLPMESLQSKTGLVIGAGGASRAAIFALHRSGVRDIYLVNRTMSKAEAIADGFRDLFMVKVVPSSELKGLSPDIIIGTIPAQETSESQFAMLFDKTQGLCIDMSYKPRMTPLLQVASRSEGWICVAGVEVLLYQAFEQFHLWTGLKAPEDVMRAAIEDS